MVESMLAEISSSKEITIVSYDVCAAKLYKSGYEGNCSISIYTYETTLDGTIHQYITSWEEIKNELITNEKYKVPSKSYVKVAVEANVGDLNAWKKIIRNQSDFIACTYVE